MIANTKTKTKQDFYSLDCYSEDSQLCKNKVYESKEEIEKYISSNNVKKYIVKKWVDKGDVCEITESDDISKI